MIAAGWLSYCRRLSDETFLPHLKSNNILLLRVINLPQPAIIILYAIIYCPYS